MAKGKVRREGRKEKCRGSKGKRKQKGEAKQKRSENKIKRPQTTMQVT